MGVHGHQRDQRRAWAHHPDIAEAHQKSALIRRPPVVVVLADHTKFGREDFARVAPLSVVDTIITDVGLDVEFAEHQSAGPSVVIV
jgi:DeoR family fructose operon transcriptional repressor